MNATTAPPEIPEITSRLARAFREYKVAHRGSAPNAAFVDVRSYEALRNLPLSHHFTSPQNIEADRIQFYGMIVLPVLKVADLCRVTQLSAEP